MTTLKKKLYLRCFEYNLFLRCPTWKHFLANFIGFFLFASGIVSALKLFFISIPKILLAIIILVAWLELSIALIKKMDKKCN